MASRARSATAAAAAAAANPAAAPSLAAPAGVRKKRAAKVKTIEEENEFKKKRAEAHRAFRSEGVAVKKRVLEKIKAEKEKKNFPEDESKSVKEWLRIEAHIDGLEAKIKELEEELNALKAEKE